MSLGWLKRHFCRDADDHVDRVIEPFRPSPIDGELRRRLDAIHLALWERKAAASRNPLLRCGAKYFSQNDEDGILLEILRRCGIREGTFLELGVGDGLENNTLILLMSGWTGAWIGDHELAFPTEHSQRLRFLRSWITPDDAPKLAGQVLGMLGKARDDVRVISLDLDSCDVYIMQSLLADGFRPQVMVVEYNGKFPPPIEFSVKPGEIWDGTDYMGASLQSWCNLLSPYAYRLVACNVTGVDAFFVRGELSSFFDDVPGQVAELFMPCDYNWFVRSAHVPSPRTIMSFL